MNIFRRMFGSESDQSINQDTLVRLKTFATASDAHIAKSILESNGIRAVVNNELANLYSPDVNSGFHLIVLQRDAEAAQKLLAEC